jgi:ketosteroid isomerase-like protein
MRVEKVEASGLLYFHSNWSKKDLGKMQMRKMLFVFLTAPLLVAVGCAPPPSTGSHGTNLAILRATDEQWSATAAKNDLDGTVAFYADDAVLLPPNAPIAMGPQSIRASWAGLLGPNTAVSWKVTKGDLAQSGELGYLYGTYQLSIRDPKGGSGVHDTGKFVEIWKKQTDGRWKCIVDTYNSDLPAPQAKS